jgi:hypothetical protein
MDGAQVVVAKITMEGTGLQFRKLIAFFFRSLWSKCV